MPEPERIDKRSLRYAGRREELLDALTRYVIDNGVGELTVRQLAKAVGVSHASLLNHFESKENLLSEVIENMRGESIPIAVPMKPGVDPATVLT
ncbi:TetR/AcrR family transcriptional regulator, partial [Rhodococcus erythropolis]